MKVFAIAMTFFFNTAFAVEITNPKLSSDRIILHTEMGDLVVALYPELAPAHAKQFLALAHNGVLDGTRFFRLQPGFVLQTALAEDRTVPLSPEQKQVIRKIPGEFNSYPHRRGSLSMARGEDPNSADTSYSILLGRAPHLDGKYTNFGELVAGWETLEAIENLPVKGDQLAQRIGITHVEVIEASKLETLTLKKPAERAGASEVKPVHLLVVVSTLMVIFLVIAFGATRMRPQVISSVALIGVLIAALVLFTYLVSVGHLYPWVAGLTFLGLLGLFRLMSGFERS